MDTKLTLKLNKDAVLWAKKYAKSQGTSVSRLVEIYFKEIESKEKNPSHKIPKITQEELDNLVIPEEILKLTNDVTPKNDFDDDDLRWEYIKEKNGL